MATIPKGARVTRANRLSETKDKNGKVTRERSVIRTDEDLAESAITADEVKAAVESGAIAVKEAK